MKAFADLLDRLSYTAARNAKLRLIEAYLRSTPDPDRGWALAALTDGVPVSLPFRKILREAVAPHADPVLYQLSRDYVGDTAETVALLWPDRPPLAADAPDLSLTEIVATMARANARTVLSRARKACGID